MSSSLSAIGPDLRNALVAMVRKRVPESEVEDVVQSALAEAVESPHAPQGDPEALRRWVFGVAKNKVVDFHRRNGRMTYELPELEGKPAPHVENDMIRWAEKNLPEGDDAQKTLDWMLREGEGEKLESIAASEKLPAPRVRQRVSRLRRHLKENWQKEVALLAAVGVLVSAIAFLLLRKPAPEPIANDPKNLPIPPAERIRKDALDMCGACALGARRCDGAEWQKCVDGLDEAKRLDPAGDTQPAVVKAREDANKALTPPPPPTPTAAPESSEPRKYPPPVPSTHAKPPPDKKPTAPKGSGFSSEFSSPAPAPTPVPVLQGKSSKMDDFGSFDKAPMPKSGPKKRVSPENPSNKRGSAMDAVPGASTFSGGGSF